MMECKIAKPTDIARSGSEAARRGSEAHMLLSYRENLSFVAVGQRLGVHYQTVQSLRRAGADRWPAGSGRWSAPPRRGADDYAGGEGFEGQGSWRSARRPRDRNVSPTGPGHGMQDSRNAAAVLCVAARSIKISLLFSLMPGNFAVH
jgi:hypothetical protein